MFCKQDWISYNLKLAIKVAKLLNSFFWPHYWLPPTLFTHILQEDLTAKVIWVAWLDFRFICILSIIIQLFRFSCIITTFSAFRFMCILSIIIQLFRFSCIISHNHFFRLSFHMYAMTIFSVFRLISFLLIVFLCEFPSLVFVLSFLVSRLGQLFSLPLDLTRVATIGSEWVWESWLEEEATVLFATSVRTIDRNTVGCLNLNYLKLKSFSVWVPPVREITLRLFVFKVSVQVRF
jgi:hypothetical protein